MFSSVLKKEISISRPVVNVFGVAIFVTLTVLGSFVRIPLPFTPVPITLQTFFVLLSGLILGARLGSLTQTIYLVLGICGLPIFASGFSGISYLFGPTGGYVLGFVIVSFMVGRLTRLTNPSLLNITAVTILGSLLILISGSAWLIVGFHFSPYQAFFAGVVPFLTGDILKSAFASVIYFNLQKKLIKK